VRPCFAAASPLPRSLSRTSTRSTTRTWAAAQRLSEQAYQKIVAAQQANEWDMEGHAQKAKELLDQVNQQLKPAAEWANKNHK
jgi:hypothetical protein